MAVLRQLPFSPPLPGYLRSAWQRAGIAHNAKLHLPLTAPAPSAVQSVPGRYWTATDGSGQVQPVLHAFAGTEEGLAALQISGGPHTWARDVAALRPELAIDTDRALLTAWNDDPWAGESYTALTVEQAPGDDQLIGAPVGRVHFAGEHTAGSWAGLMRVRSDPRPRGRRVRSPLGVTASAAARCLTGRLRQRGSPAICAPDRSSSPLTGPAIVCLSTASPDVPSRDRHRGLPLHDADESQQALPGPNTLDPFGCRPRHWRETRRAGPSRAASKRTPAGSRPGPGSRTTERRHRRAAPWRPRTRCRRGR
jgi:hypothetical protein